MVSFFERLKTTQGVKREEGSEADREMLKIERRGLFFKIGMKPLEIGFFLAFCMLVNLTFVVSVHASPSSDTGPGQLKEVLQEKEGSLESLLWIERGNSLEELRLKPDKLKMTKLARVLAKEFPDNSSRTLLRRAESNVMSKSRSGKARADKALKILALRCRYKAMEAEATSTTLMLNSSQRKIDSVQFSLLLLREWLKDTLLTTPKPYSDMSSGLLTTVESCILNIDKDPFAVAVQLKALAFKFNLLAARLK